MKYQEAYAGSKEECFALVKETFNQLVKGSLEVEGNKVVLPKDKDIETKVKYINDLEEGKLTIKIQWMNIDEIEEDEEIEF